MLDVMNEARVRAGEAHAAWSERFNEMFAQVAGSSRTRGRGSGRGPMCWACCRTQKRGNGWTLAEFAGDLSPDGMQRLLNFYASTRRGAGCGAPVRGQAPGRPVRGAGGRRDRFPEEGPDVGGGGPAEHRDRGPDENAQVGVFLAYAASDGSRALIDRELYLPEKWTTDRDRCRAAGIADEVAFATKPKLAQDMVERALKAGVPFAWVAADEVYGQNPGLRDWLEGQQIGYVMAVPCSELITVAAGRRKRADALARLVPREAWQRLSCADGSKGPRLYDWALVDAASGDHRLLVRRSLRLNEKGEKELAYFWCYAPRGAALAELVAVAGARWAVEDCFAEAKNETGLDHYQVRLYQAWYRHITLSMLAHAFLAVTAHALRPGPVPPGPPPVGADDSEPDKKGCRSLWTSIQAAEDV